MVQADRRRAAAVLHAGLDEFFPSPLVGEGAFAKRRRMRGSIREQQCSWSQPLTQPSLWPAPVMPSPTRGEGAATGAAEEERYSGEKQHADQVR